jgi:polyisoprenoid-binding protein YceI
MTPAQGRRQPARNRTRKPPRRRHWWRWILGGAIVLIALVAASIGLFFKLQPAPSPLILPAAAAKAPAGPLDGTWHVAAGSVAGFRVQETFVGLSNDVVGRTKAVTGTITVAGNQVTAATFRVDLATIKVRGKTEPQFATSLDTQNHPDATVKLTEPVPLSHAFTAGSAVTTTATGHLAMRGASHLVTLAIAARRGGAQLQAAGSIPITYSHWGIDRPGGYGSLASLASHGVAEFLLVLVRHQ